MTRPLLDAYLAALPDGLASYATFQQKGSVTRVLLEEFPEARSLRDLPPPLAELIAHPPLPSAWIPETHAMSVWLLAADEKCGGDPRALEAFSFTVNRRLFEQPMYRLAFRVLGASLSVRAISAAWSTFHRGIVQRVTLSPGACEVRLQHPAHLIAPALVPSYGAAFLAGLETIGVRGRVEVLACEPETTRYRATWAT